MISAQFLTCREFRILAADVTFRQFNMFLTSRTLRPHTRKALSGNVFDFEKTVGVKVLQDFNRPM